MRQYVERLVTSSKAEFDSVFNNSDWDVHIFRFDWSSLKSAGSSNQNPTPKMEMLSSSAKRPESGREGLAAAATALLHSFVVSTRSAPAISQVKGSMRQSEGGSIFSVPILDSVIYQPNPGAPLLLGTAGYSGPLSVSDAIKDYRLRVLATKYSDLLADQLHTEENSSSFPAEAFLAKSIEVDGKKYGLDLDSQIDEISHFPQARKRITDRDLVDWYEFQSGLFATSMSLMEYRFLRERVWKSISYRQTLHDS